MLEQTTKEPRGLRKPGRILKGRDRQTQTRGTRRTNTCRGGEHVCASCPCVSSRKFPRGCLENGCPVKGDHIRLRQVVTTLCFQTVTGRNGEGALTSAPLGCAAWWRARARVMTRQRACGDTPACAANWSHGSFTPPQLSAQNGSLTAQNFQVIPALVQGPAQITP